MFFLYLFIYFINSNVAGLSNEADPSKGTMGSEGLLCWTAYLAHLSSDGYKVSMHKK
jgi:hypothetical protein